MPVHHSHQSHQFHRTSRHGKTIAKNKRKQLIFHPSLARFFKRSDVTVLKTVRKSAMPLLLNHFFRNVNSPTPNETNLRVTAVQCSPPHTHLFTQNSIFSLSHSPCRGKQKRSASPFDINSTVHEQLTHFSPRRQCNGQIPQYSSTSRDNTRRSIFDIVRFIPRSYPHRHPLSSTLLVASLSVITGSVASYTITLPLYFKVLFTLYNHAY